MAKGGRFDFVTLHALILRSVISWNNAYEGKSRFHLLNAADADWFHNPRAVERNRGCHTELDCLCPLLAGIRQHIYATDPPPPSACTEFFSLYHELQIHICQYGRCSKLLQGLP